MKPGDFLIGLRDFFAVLIPGAVLTFLIGNFFPAGIHLPSWWTPLAVSIAGLGTAEKTLAYAIIAYAFGQVISSFSTLLDFPIDVFERNYGQTTGRYFLWGIDPDARIVIYRRMASELKDKVAYFLLGCEKNLWSTKGFWKDFLRLYEPLATAELDRLEGNEKLFRSLSVVFLFASVLTVCTSNWSATFPTLLAFAVCLLLYARFRMSFMYRLYKLAVLTSLDSKIVKDLAREGVV